MIDEGVPVTTQPARWASPEASPQAQSEGLISPIIALLLLFLARLPLGEGYLNELESRHFADKCAP